jgi:hypothetical protein
MAKISTLQLPKNATRSYTDAEVKNILKTVKNRRVSKHIYQGRIIFFFTMGSKEFTNAIKKDGFIWKARHDYELVPPRREKYKLPFIASIFARNKGEEYIYLGDVNYIVYEDSKHSKMLWK